MAKTKTARKSAGALRGGTHLCVAQHVTIQEPKPSKFKIVLGEHDGIVWDCYPKSSTTVEDAKRAYLRTINKTSNSYLTQEQIDHFTYYVREAGFFVEMFTSNWKELFARRFRRFLARKGITLEQIEAQGFGDPVSKRWLRNLYKNGISRENQDMTVIRLFSLHRVLGITSSDDF
jgi:hypothetical protein